MPAPGLVDLMVIEYIKEKWALYIHTLKNSALYRVAYVDVIARQVSLFDLSIYNHSRLSMAM